MPITQCAFAASQKVTHKICPHHLIGMIRFRHISDRTMSHLRIFNKFYKCEKCMLGGVHVYCYICNDTFIAGYPYVNNTWDHNKKFHNITLENLLNTPRMLMSIAAMGIVFSIIEELIINNPQFYVILPDNTDSGPEIRDVINDFKKDIFDPTVRKHYTDLLTKLVENCIKSPSRTYSCIFCGVEYDCLPCVKLATEHIRICPIICKNKINNSGN